jgi:hypothetical protein
MVKNVKKCQNHCTLVCGMAHMVVCQLAVQQAEFDSRLGTPWRLLLLSREAMKIQEDRPRQMMKDERMYECIV